MRGSNNRVAVALIITHRIWHSFIIFFSLSSFLPFLVILLIFRFLRLQFDFPHGVYLLFILVLFFIFSFIFFFLSSPWSQDLMSFRILLHSPVIVVSFSLPFTLTPKVISPTYPYTSPSPSFTRCSQETLIGFQFPFAVTVETPFRFTKVHSRICIIRPNNGKYVVEWRKERRDAAEDVPLET